MIHVLLALIIPLLAMVIITRISYSIIGATIVTAMISFFVLHVHDSVVTAILAIISFLVGLKIARDRQAKKRT